MCVLAPVRLLHQPQLSTASEAFWIYDVGLLCAVRTAKNEL